MSKFGGSVHKLEFDFFSVLAAKVHQQRLREGRRGRDGEEGKEGEEERGRGKGSQGGTGEEEKRKRKEDG